MKYNLIFILCLLLCIVIAGSICINSKTVEIAEPIVEIHKEYAAAPSATVEPTPAIFVVTEYKSMESEDFLWTTINKYSPSKELSAAILGYFWRESYYKSNAITHWDIIDKMQGGDSSADFTTEIDAGLADGSTKEYFITKVHNDMGGYGLGQWYTLVYLNAFYDFAQEWGTSIADAEMQCAFTVWSIYHQHDKFFHKLNIESVSEASQWMGIIYDGSSMAAGVITLKAEEIYKKNAE